MQLTPVTMLWTSIASGGGGGGEGKGKILSCLTHSPLNRPCGSRSFLPFVTSSVLTVKDNFLRTRVQSEGIFQTIPE